MSAIEMMDPKMDSGMICNRVQRKVYNLEQGIENGRIKIENIDDEEKIGIIDDTFACLVTWLEGHSLAQTVFTNLYLQNPPIIKDKTIRTLSYVTLRLVEIIRGIIVDSGVFEEEDFQAMTYNYRLDWDIPDVRLVSWMKEIEEESSKSVKSLRREVEEMTKGGERGEEVGVRVEEVNRKIALKNGLGSRARFIRSFHLLLLDFSKPRRDSQTKIITFPDDTTRHLDHCSQSLASWFQTVHLGVKAPSSRESNCDKNSSPSGKVTSEEKVTSSDLSESRADYPTISGFDPLINQRLLPPTFPRYAEIRSRRETVEYLVKLVNRFTYLINGIQCVTDLHKAMDFLSDFSRLSNSSTLPQLNPSEPNKKPAEPNKKPSEPNKRPAEPSSKLATGSSCVLSRSILQSCYLHQTNSGRFSETVKEGIDVFIRGGGMQWKDPLIVEGIESFTRTCSKVLMSLVIINGHNRARQREKWVMILEELGHLQSESDSLDALIKIQVRCRSEGPIGSETGIFCTYILYHILRVMIKYTLTGFELELYSAHEYHYIYWYLYEFILGWMVSTLTRASNIVEEQTMLMEANKSSSVKGKKKENERKKNKKKGACVKERAHVREIMYYQGMQQLTGGLCKCIGAFKKEGCIKVPKMTGGDSKRNLPPNTNSDTNEDPGANQDSDGNEKSDENLCTDHALFGSEQIRYEHRFMPFSTVFAPPVVTYGQYVEMTQKYASAQTTDDLYMIAQHCFEEASRIFSNIANPDDEVRFALQLFHDPLAN